MSRSNGWAPQVPLGEVVQHRKNFVEIDDLTTYKRCRVQLHAKGILLRDEVEGAAIKTKKQQICRTDDFLVAEIDAKIGGFGIVPGELDGAIVSSHYFLFDPIRDRLDPRFLGYYCRTSAFRDQVTARGTTNYAAIRPSHVLGYNIPMPPLAEQRRIVAKIERLAGKIEEARGLQEECTLAASAFRLSSIAHAFDSTSPQWKTYQIGDLLIEDCYGTSEKARLEPEGVPVLRMGNIQDGALDTTDLRYLTIREKDRPKWILQRGDILVNRTNSAELVGKCAVYDLDGEWTFASYLIRLRVDHNRVLPQLLAHYINSPKGRSYMFREKKQMTGQANVNAKTIRAMHISLPPREEQDTLLSRIDALIANARSLRAQQRRVSRTTDALMPSILDRAFRGELQ